MLDAGPLRRALYRWGLHVGHAVHVARLDGKPVRLWHRLCFPLANTLILRPLRDQLGLTRLRLASCGGATMAPNAFRLFHAMGIPLRNMYGSTEAGLLTCCQGACFDLETVGTWMQAHPQAGPRPCSGASAPRGNCRFAVPARFRADGLYQENASAVDMQIPVTYQAGRRSHFQARVLLLAVLPHAQANGGAGERA